MPKSPTIYSEEKSNEMGKKLKSLVDNPKGLMLQDLISEHRESILAALRVGHSYEDVCAALAEIDISIKATTLKQYLQKSPSANKPKSKSKDTDEQSDDQIDPNESQEIEATEAEPIAPAPKKPLPSSSKPIELAY